MMCNRYKNSSKKRQNDINKTFLHTATCASSEARKTLIMVIRSKEVRGHQDRVFSISLGHMSGSDAELGPKPWLVFMKMKDQKLPYFNPSLNLNLMLKHINFISVFRAGGLTEDWCCVANQYAEFQIINTLWEALSAQSVASRFAKSPLSHLERHS